jgi:hypothetical protein
VFWAQVAVACAIELAVAACAGAGVVGDHCDPGARLTAHPALFLSDTTPSTPAGDPDRRVSLRRNDKKS